MPTMVPNAERELVEACKGGDRDAFRTLFETYKNKVYSVALRFSGDEAAAMDIAQDTFVKLFSCMGDFRGESGFETWVYRMVANRCLDQRRRTRRLIPLADELMATLRASGDVLTQMLRDELGNRVRAAVEKLPPDLRIVIVLRYTEGLAYDRIADVLACSPGTVASRLNRAHKELERRLAHLAQGGAHA